MPVTLDATVSGISANSYASVADAIAYLSTTRYGLAFANSTDTDTQARCLIEFTNIIDLEMYQGDVAAADQRLKWPRIFILQPYDPNIQIPKNAIPPGVFVPLPRYYPSDIIIRPVFESCCEGAAILFQSGLDPFGEDDTLQQKGQTVGPIRTDYVDPAYRRTGIWRYPKIAQRLGPLVMASRQLKVRRA